MWSSTTKLQIFFSKINRCHLQKQPSRGVLRKRYSENMQQIYRKTPMPCNFIEITLGHRCSPVKFAACFQNTSGRATSKTWTQTLDLDPGHGPRKTSTLKNLDPEKHGKPLDAEKRYENHIVQFISTEETCKQAI